MEDGRVKTAASRVEEVVYHLTLCEGSKKKMSFSKYYKFYSNGFFNEYLIKWNCTSGNVPSSTKIYKSIGFGVG